MLDQVQQHGLAGPATHLRHPVDAFDQHGSKIRQDEIGHARKLPEIAHDGHACPSVEWPEPIRCHSQASNSKVGTTVNALRMKNVEYEVASTM